MKRVLLFVWREAHVEVIQARANPSDLIVSLNLDVSVRLRGLGIEYCEMTDFIDAGELRGLLEEGYQLSQTWFQPFEADCRIGGVSALANEALALAPFIADGLIAKHLFAAVMRRHSVEQAILFEHPTDQIVITENGSSPDLWTAVWQMMAAARDIEVTSVAMPADAAAHQANPVEKIQRLVSDTRNMIVNWAVWQRHFVRTARQHKKTACFVVMINEAYRYAQLYDEIAKTFDKGRLIPAVLGARRAGGIQFKKYDWAYRSLSLLPSLRYVRVWTAARRWHDHFLAFQKTYTGEHPELFANPQLAAQFQRFFLRFLPSSLQVYEGARAIFQRMNTRVVIAATFPMTHTASVHAAARDLNIPVLALPHSGGPTDKVTRLPGDKTFVWSQDYRRAWQPTQGDTPLIVTGLHPSIIAQGYEQTQAWKPAERTRKRITLLLATNQTGIRQWVDMRQHYESLSWIAKVPPHLQDKIEVIFKLHPVHDYRFVYQSLVPEQSDYVKIIRNVSLETMLRESQLAVMVHVATSAHLLALAERIPLLYVNTVRDTIISDTLAIDEWGEGMTIHQNEQIWERIEHVLFDPTAQNQLLAANQSYWKRLEAGEHDPVTMIRDTLAPYLE